MSENDETGGTDAPEFVAVTPRPAGGRGETPSAPVEPEATEATPDDTADDSGTDSASGTDAEPPTGVTEPATPQTAAVPAVSEPAAEKPAAAEPSPAAEAPAAEPAVPDAAPRGVGDSDSADPAITLPSFGAIGQRHGAETASPAAPETAAAVPAASEPAAEPSPADQREVPVRVAAEGMAAALAGEPTSPTEADETQGRSVGPLAVATVVAAVLAIAAGVLLGISIHSNSHHDAVAKARVQALEAAKRETAVALTYDYRSLDADFQRAEAGMSRKFKANYAQTAASSVAPLATKTHAITTGSVAAGGVVSATPNTARILVFANQTVENKLLNATSRLDRSVIEVSMVKEDGRWVIDNLQPF